MKSSIPICKTLDQEESVEPKECNSDLHLINSIDKQFPTSKASQHGEVWKGSSSNPIPLLALSNSALPLSQAPQTQGAKCATTMPRLLIFPPLPSLDQELRCQHCKGTPEILLKGLKIGKIQRKGSKDASSLMDHAFSSFLPPGPSALSKLGVIKRRKWSRGL